MNGVERYDMGVEFARLLELLSKNLYTHREAFVRELIQNACDAIRRLIVSEPSHVGRVNVSIDSGRREIAVSDNGVGMDRDDLRRFLSVIGSSGTGTEARTLLA